MPESMVSESRNDEPHSRADATSQTQKPKLNIHEQAAYSWLNDTDERRRNAILNVRRQGEAECCYAFGIVDAMYASQYLSDGHAVKGSEQDFLDFLHHTDFSFDYDDHVKIDKCGISNSLENATDYVKYHGLLLDEDYEYQSICQDNGDPDWFYEKRPKTRKLYADFMHIEDDHTYLVGDGKFGGFLRVQPVLACIRSTPSFQDYSNAHVGVYDHTKKEWEHIWQYDNVDDKGFPDHVILLVGYGEENGVEYYIAKNCWGPDWGHDGFIKLKRTCVEGLGGFWYPTSVTIDSC
ncbi:hypothetical protein OROGR_012145 [Orobanche gracilis]